MRAKVVWSWAAILGAVLLAQTWVRAARPDGIDLTSYLLSARALLHGGSPYVLPTPFPYLYPATLAFLLIPLTSVPSSVAVVVWFAVSAAAAVWSVRRVLMAARPDLDARPADVAAFVAIFFTFFFTVLQSNLRNGQVNLLVLALCVAAVGEAGKREIGRKEIGSKEVERREGAAPAAMPSGLPRGISDSSRRGWGPGASAKKLTGSLSWALAVAIKLVPLVLLPYFTLRRSWRWMLASALLIVAWCLLPVVVLGSRIADIYDQYWRVFLASSFGPRVQPLDFSLGGTLAWATRVPLTPWLKVSAAAVVLGRIFQVDARRLYAWNVASNDLAQGPSSAQGPSKNVAQGFSPADTRALALYLLAIPLASPQSEVHHLAFMLPAAAIVGADVWWEGRRAARSLQFAAGLAAVLYLAATAIRIASGQLFCAALIACGWALMQVPRAEQAPPLRAEPAEPAPPLRAEPAEPAPPLHAASS